MARPIDNLPTPQDDWTQARIRAGAERRAQGAREDAAKAAHDKATEFTMFHVSGTAALANFIRAKSYPAAVGAFKADYDKLAAGADTRALLEELRFSDKDAIEAKLKDHPQADQFRKALIYDQVLLQDATSPAHLKAIKAQEDTAKEALITNVRMLAQNGKPIDKDKATAIVEGMSKAADAYLKEHPGTTYEDALKGAFEAANKAGIAGGLHEFRSQILQNQQIKDEESKFHNLIDHLALFKDPTKATGIWGGAFLAPITKDVSLAQLEGHSLRFLQDAASLTKHPLDTRALKLGLKGPPSNLEEQAAILQCITESVMFDYGLDAKARKVINVGIKDAATGISGVGTEISAAWTEFFKDKPVDDKTYASFAEKFKDKFKDFFEGAGKSYANIKDKVVVQVNVAEMGRHAMEQWFIMADPQHTDYGQATLTEAHRKALSEHKGPDGKSTLERLETLAKASLDNGKPRDLTKSPLTYRDIALFGLSEEVRREATRYTATNSKTARQGDMQRYVAELHPKSLFGLQATGDVNTDIPAHMQAKYMVHDTLKSVPEEPALMSSVIPPKGKKHAGVKLHSDVALAEEDATLDPKTAEALALAKALRDKAAAGRHANS